MQKLTEDQIHQGLAKFSEWFPNESAKMQTHKDKIVEAISTGAAPNPVLLGLDFTPKNSSLGSENFTVAGVEITPCEMDIAVVVLDSVCFILDLVGLHISNTERVNRAIARKLGTETLNGFKSTIHNFSTATKKLDKADALFSLLGGIYNAGGLRVVFVEIADEMSWWEWAKTGIIAVAQIIAWLATDGVAFVAEAVLTIMDAEQLIEDSASVCTTCG